MSPRYDIPKAAPEPLRQVQLLINSVDLVHEVEWLADWLRDRRLEGQERRARDLREALRALVLVNNGVPLAATALDVLNRAATRLSLEFDERGSVQVRRRGRRSRGDALDEVVAIVVRGMLDGSWARLKACRNCRWCFFDYSPNQSATWCSMKLCGNRAKTRAFRARRQQRRASTMR
jgi:predicted RNA-binding Zn ribbon-like protein